MKIKSVAFSVWFSVALATAPAIAQVERYRFEGHFLAPSQGSDDLGFLFEQDRISGWLDYNPTAPLTWQEPDFSDRFFSWAVHNGAATVGPFTWTFSSHSHKRFEGWALTRIERNYETSRNTQFLHLKLVSEGTPVQLGDVNEAHLFFRTPLASFEARLPGALPSSQWTGSITHSWGYGEYPNYQSISRNFAVTLTKDVAPPPPPPPPSPPKNIIVLTHGWNDADDGLAEIKSAVDAKLETLGVADRTEVIHHIWAGAQTGYSPEAYINAHGRTQYAGSNLAMKIAEIVGEGRRLDPDYDPIIHFIGHSLGTHVNAYAVKTLGKSVTVEQFTILDSPLHPISHAAFFRDKLSGGSVEYVENFYVDELLELRFGSPIAGAGPCIGSSTELACSGIAVGGGWDHMSIASDFYPRLISGGDPSDIPSLRRPWNSPILDGWRPDERWDSDAAFQELRRLIQQVAAEIPESAVRQIRGSVSTEVQEGDLFVTLTPNSPAEFEVLLDVPLNAYALLLDIDATKDSLATLQVYLDGQLRWTWSTGSFESGLFTAEIDASGLGEVTNLSFVYDPAGVLDPLVVSNFRFAVVTAVPEPSTTLAMAAGLLLLFAKSASSVARRNGLRRNGGVSGTRSLSIGFLH